jgi:D-aminopeptidase
MGSSPDRETPFFFQKISEILLLPGSDLEYPDDTNELHHEVELVVAISNHGYKIHKSEAKDISPNTVTHATMHGVGDSSISLQPGLSVNIIKRKSEESLNGDLTKSIWAYPSRFKLVIRYMKHVDAYKASHYSGAIMLTPKSVCYEDRDYDNIMRFILFCV